jgi:hypothetical protein
MEPMPDSMSNRRLFPKINRDKTVKILAEGLKTRGKNWQATRVQIEK